MKDGRVIEVGSVTKIFDNPKNEYTRTLISAAFDIENAATAE